MGVLGNEKSHLKQGKVMMNINLKRKSLLLVSASVFEKKNSCIFCSSLRSFAPNFQSLNLLQFDYPQVRNLLNRACHHIDSELD
jgi:hypothetical protein